MTIRNTIFGHQMGKKCAKVTFWPPFGLFMVTLIVTLWPLFDQFLATILPFFGHFRYFFGHFLATFLSLFGHFLVPF